MASDGAERLESRTLLATFTWQGDESTVWSAPGNWVENVAPTPGTPHTLVFDSNTTGFTAFASSNDIVGLTGIEFQVVSDGAESIRAGGQAIELAATAITASGTNSDGVQFQMPLTLGAPASIQHDAQVQTTSTFDLNGHSLTLSGAERMSMFGSVTGTGDINANSGLLGLLAANSFSGTLTVGSGAILDVRANDALGATSGPTIVNGGSVRLTNGVDYTAQEPLIFNGGSVQAAFGDASFDGPVTLNSSTSFGIASAPQTLTVNGVIDGPGELVAFGQTLVLTADNTYTGPTSVSNAVLPATLQLDGSLAAASAVSVSGTLLGTGTANGPVTVNFSGTVSPGNSPGSLSTGDLDFGFQSNFDVEIDGTAPGQFDVIDVTGTVTLRNFVLNLSGSHTPSEGEEFLIINNDGGDAVVLDNAPAALTETVGTLNGVPLALSYTGGDGNDVVLIAAPIVVTTAVDENDGNPDPMNGMGTSLREAIIAANADPGLSVIVFDPNLNGTPIVLTIAGGGEDAAATGDLDITSEIRIGGNGSSVTVVDAGGDTGLGDRVFDVHNAASLTLDGVTVQGGRIANPFRGAGIRVVDGDLSVRNSTVTGNSAELTGGGIDAYRSTVDVTTSTISGNTTTFGDGGGLRVSRSTVEISESTLTGNESGANGGGIHNTGTLPDRLRIENSTISGNTAGAFGGGVSSMTANLEVVNSTIFSNGSDLSYGGNLYFYSRAGFGTGTVDNTIIAGSTNGPDISGTALAGSNNLVQDGSGTGLTGTVTGDPVLSPLQDNGGPTLTHALFTGSPAENAGDNALAVDAGSIPLTTDQRGAGFPRILDTTVDIGAVEGTISPPDSFVVDIATDEADGDLTPGDVSLRDAIIAANADPNPTTITFDPALNGMPIVLTIMGTDEDGSLTGDLDINTDVTIMGNGSANTLIQAGTLADRSDSVDRVFHIVGGVDVAFSDVTISHGLSDQSGAGIAFGDGMADGQLTISGSVLTNNENQGVFGDVGGGGLSVVGGTAHISGTTISDNTAFLGGGIFGEGSDVTVDQNSVISGNIVQTEGGGVYVRGSATDRQTLTITDTMFLNNSASVGGGLGTVNSQTTVTNSRFEDNQTVSGPGAGINGLRQFGGTGNSFLEVSGSTFLNNSAIGGGGGISSSEDNLTVTNSRFEGNSTTGMMFSSNGGAITVDRSMPNGTEVLITDTDFISNTSAAQGGAIANRGHHVEVSGGTFDGNSAAQGGGAIHTASGGGFEVFTLLVGDATLTNNSAASGGAIFNQGDHVEVTNSTISVNTATDDGGGIYTSGMGGGLPATLILTSSTVDNNMAGGNGGGIYNTNDHVDITNSTVSSNEAGGQGGGVYTVSEGRTLTLLLSSSTIVLNKAGTDGGGIYNSGDSVTLTNTIVAGNTGAFCEPDDIGGDAVDNTSSFNVIGDAGSSGGLTDGNNGNFVGAGGAGPRSVGAIVSPLLSDNGGATLTHGLVPSSVAIDAGSAADLPEDRQDLDGDSDMMEALPVDQRGVGFDRVQNGTLDIGAVEGVLQFGVLPVDPALRTEAVDSVDVFFTSAIDAATFTADDITLTRDGLAVDTSTLTVSDEGGGTFRINGLATLTADDGRYLLTIAGAGINDSGGQPLTDDGAVLWKTDSVFPPKTPIEPLGSLIYDPVITRSLAAAGDVQSLTLEVDASQTISVIVTPTSTLQPSVDVLDPGSASVGSVTAAAAGDVVVIQTIPVTTAGTHTVSVSGAGGTTGSFELDVILNAAIEDESHGGPSNDTTATAEDIDTSFLNLGLADVERGAVVGRVDGGTIYTLQRRDNLLRTMDLSGNTLSTQTVTVAGDTVNAATGLATDPATGTTYALLDLDAGGRGNLATIDLATAQATVLAQISNPDNTNSPQFGEIVFDAAGNLYGVTGDRGVDRRTLFAIDKTNPSSRTALHQFASGGAGGVALNTDDGLLYRSYGSTLQSIDVSNPMMPVVTEITVTGDMLPRTEAMIYLGNNEFFAYSGGGGNTPELFTITTSGVSTIVGQLDHNNIAHGMLLVSGTDSTDVYSFDLADGDVVSLVIEGGGTLELLDPAGSPLETAVGGHSNVDGAIQAFTVSGAGTYFAQVSSGIAVDYTVVVTRNAAFDLETNNDPASAQDIGASDAVLGHVNAVVTALGANGVVADLLVIDPSTGSIIDTLASGVGNGRGYGEITRNPVTGVVYATQARQGHDLFQVDPVTGAETLLGQPAAGLRALAWSLDGTTLYGARGDFSGDSFGTIDPVAGTYNEIAVPANRIGGMAVQPGTGALFGVLNQSSGLVTISPADGTQTPVGDPGITFNSLTFLPDGTLLAGGSSNDGALYELDPATGAATLIGDTLTSGSENLTGLAALPATDDYFSFDVTSGETIDLFTQTPAGGPGEFVNLLDPAIELIDPTGAPVAMDDNGFVDGRNAQLSHTATMTGTWVVRVSAAGDTAGEYVLLRGLPPVPDTTPPAVTVDSLSTTDDTPGLTGTVSEDTTLISVEVGGQTHTAVNNGDGTWTLADDVISPALPAGVHNVTVTATDLAGNTGTDSTTNELAIAVMAFDFGAVGSPVEAGHTQVLITDVIPGTPSAGDFGWQNNAGISDRDRTNVPDDGDRDYHKTGAGSVTFQAVVPNGDYDVTFTIGSGADPRHNVGVLFEGTQVATISSPPGQFRTETHTVTVADGMLDLQLQRQGFTASGINSLVILPAAVEPAVDAADPAVFVKVGDPPVVVDPGLTVTDPDDVNLTGAEVRVTAGFVPGQDVLGFTDQLGITGSFDGATGVLTLSGTASVADYQTALRTVTFATTGTIDGPRTVQFAASDATGTGFDARTVNVTPAGGTMLDFDFGTAGSPVATGFTAVEIDDAFNATDGYGWLNDAVANNISARDRSAPDAERQDYHKVGSGSMTFAVNLPNGTYDVTVTIGSNVDPRNGVGVFLENTQVDTVNTAASQFSTETHRVTVTDGRLELRLQRQGSTGVGINSLRIAEVTTAPTVDLADGPAVFQNGGGAIAVDGNLTVDDIDSANLTGATVRIAAGHNAAADTLSFTDQLGITGSYDGPSGVLTLSGSASVADYQTALRSVEFNTTDNTGTRTVEVTVDDGSQTGSDTRVINVTPPFTGASYDFGTATSNVEAGFIGVDETTAFTSAQGYGWLSTTGIESRNRSAPVPLDERRDYNLIRSGSMTFAVSLPNGTYDVQVTVGSSENARTGVGILLEGTQVTTINTAAMNFAVETHQVTVTDNRLEIEIARQGPTAAGINAVVINQIP